MARYNHILVAVDGSPSSLHAFQEALHLQPAGATVMAVAPPYEGDLRLVGVDRIKTLMQEPCETALTRCQNLAQAAGIGVKAICAIGEADVRIAELADEENCDLIVMGAKGHSFIDRALMGSVTRRVISQTPCDVLVVPLAAQLGFQKVLLATDGATDTPGAADRALEVAQAYGARLHIVSVVKAARLFRSQAPEALAALKAQRQQALDGIKTQAQALNINATAIVRESDDVAYHVIVDEARKGAADMIIMGSHGHRGLKRFILGSLTEKVIGHASCPILVVKV